MIAFSFGPLVLPANLISLLIALIVAGLVGRWVGRLHGTTISGVLADMVLAAVVSARAVFVLLWLDHYRASLWSALDLRDGGFTVWAGIVSAAFLGAWRAWREPGLRKPLLYGLLSAGSLWILSPGVIRFGSGPELAAVSTASLTTRLGAPVSLAAIASGKALVVNLWATWCPPCRREMPVLEAAQRTRSDIVFVFADQGEGGAAVNGYLSQKQESPANVLLDPMRSIGKPVGSFGLPTTLFYDEKGRLVDTHVGALSSATLAASLARLAMDGAGRP